MGSEMCIRDRAWSQWMDALRAGRARTYIPESYIPRNPETGELLKASAFDNRFIAGDDNMGEGGKNQILTEQPDIPHESYLASYVTALDLCLQGIISPSTLGIDVKKLDNAEAQREKEKATLYTRNAIVEALQKQPADFSAFLRLMEESGFLVKHGRGGVISFLAPGQDKPTRLRASTLGDGFDPEDIRAVIAGVRPIPELPQEALAPARRVNLIIDLSLIHI